MKQQGRRFRRKTDENRQKKETCFLQKMEMPFNVFFRFLHRGSFLGMFRLLHFLFSCVRLSDICQGYLKLCVVIMVV